MKTERRRLAGWLGAVSAPFHNRRRDAAGPAGEDAGVPFAQGVHAE
jgi:hypothetical protein